MPNHGGRETPRSLRPARTPSVQHRPAWGHRYSHAEDNACSLTVVGMTTSQSQDSSRRSSTRLEHGSWGLRIGNQSSSMKLSMSKGIKLVLLKTVLVVTACWGQENKVGCGKEPLYARYASTTGTTQSPDGTKTLTAERVESDNDPDGSHIRYRLQIGKKRFSSRIDGFSTEVLWSPDSKSFAVNQTEGGGGIGQRAYIFYVTRNGLQRLDVSAPIEKAFGSPVKCEVPVPPNTAVLQWLDPKRILVVAEVVNVSICKCPGTFQSYELSIPNLRIIRRYTQSGTKRGFAGVLGCELRDADDKCARRWQKETPSE